MRVLFAIVVFVVAGIAAAGADGVRRHSALDVRIAPLVIYDYQPGVVVRAYWRAPWRQRHYFPRTGEKPEVGRDEDLSTDAGGVPEPAESFQRSWSTSSAFLPEAPRRQPLDGDLWDEPQKIPAPLK